MLIATLDIETAAQKLSPKEARALVKVDGRWSSERQEAHRNDPEVQAEARYRLAVDPARCVVVGGAIAINERDPEWMLLPTLLDCIADLGVSAWFAGHNIAAFDIPALAFEALRIRHPATRVLWGIMRAKPWERRLLDTLDATSYRSTFGKLEALSLDALCELLELPGPKPGTISGVDCPKAYDEGRIDDIADHCIDDVLRERLAVVECIRAGMFGVDLPAWAGSIR